MIPTVDLGAPAVVDGLVAALSTFGFVSLVGHGLEMPTMDRLRSAADEFFDLPTEVKRTFVHPDPLANRGFRAKGSEALAYSLGDATPPDLFESFNGGPDAPGHWTDLVQPTPWPDQPVPDYRPAAAAALAQFDELGRRVDALLDAVLDLDDLAGRSTCGPDMLACIDYRPNPNGDEPLEPGQLRMGAHTDYTSYTLLLADPVPGLQILGPAGHWMDVLPEPGSLLMNVGDLLAMWTNDQWPSTLHRVLPMARGGATRRRSVAWFHYPDPYVVVAPLPAFVAGSGGKERYSPVRVDDHVRGKLGSPKTLSDPTSASTLQDRTI